MVLNQISMTDDHVDRLIPHEAGVTSHLNRYSDILPFEYSTVKLDKNGDEKANEYINANFIPTPNWEKFNSWIVTKDNSDEHDLNYIACQGPTKSTVEDFWRMVKQENIGVVVMLWKLKEGGRPKWEQYWPDEGKTVSFTKSGISIECGTVEETSSNLYFRNLILTHRDSEEKHTIKHIQYSGWPDHGVPEETAFDDFDTLMETWIGESQRMHTEGKGEKFLVHCSAGIGRTGTLLTLMHILPKIKASADEGTPVPKIQIFSVLRKLREYRYHLVQTDVQYMFIYEYLSTYLKKLRLI